MMQFRIVTLLTWTTLAAVAFVLAKIWRFEMPAPGVLATLAFFPFVFVGLPMLVFSGFMALSISLNPHSDFHRQDNLRNCLRMLAGGTLASAPFVCLFGYLLIDNLT